MGHPLFFLYIIDTKMDHMEFEQEREVSHQPGDLIVKQIRKLFFDGLNETQVNELKKKISQRYDHPLKEQEEEENSNIEDVD